jgi:hypothetical protein
LHPLRLCGIAGGNHQQGGEDKSTDHDLTSMT